MKVRILFDPQYREIIKKILNYKKRSPWWITHTQTTELIGNAFYGITKKNIIFMLSKYFDISFVNSNRNGYDKYIGLGKRL